MNHSSSHAFDDDNGSNDSLRCGRVGGVNSNNISGSNVSTQGDGEKSYDSLEWDGFWDRFHDGYDDGSIDDCRSNDSFSGGVDDGNIGRSNDSFHGGGDGVDDNVSYIRGGGDGVDDIRSSDATQVDGVDDVRSNVSTQVDGGNGGNVVDDDVRNDSIYVCSGDGDASLRSNDSTIADEYWDCIDVSGSNDSSQVDGGNGGISRFKRGNTDFSQVQLPSAPVCWDILLDNIEDGQEIPKEIHFHNVSSNASPAGGGSDVGRERQHRRDGIHQDDWPQGPWRHQGPRQVITPCVFRKMGVSLSFFFFTFN